MGSQKTPNMQKYTDTDIGLNELETLLEGLFDYR